MTEKQKTVFISADHGLAIVYFLQSDVVKTMIEGGVRVVLLTDAILKEQIEARFGQDGLIVEDLRIKEARDYFNSYKPSMQFWLDFLRRAGASHKINLVPVENYIEQVQVEATGKRKLLMPVMKLAVTVMHYSKLARKLMQRMQRQFVPHLYDDLFEKYAPEMVVASTPGWRFDKYLLREAAARGITTTTVIVGWDNSCSYNLSGADMDYATCWSELQKQELVLGSDWDPEKVNIGGIPSYDGYFLNEWVMPKEDYFELHGLDSTRKLISYASSFVSFSPNIQNIEALAELVNEDALAEPSQLLVRLHPNHFMNKGRFAAEREAVREMVKTMPHVHLVEPVALGGELGHYSGEDMPEKTSMMAHSDVFVTVYSTMVVETAIHRTPIIAECIDHEVGWTENFYLPLSEISDWETHRRFIEAKAGTVVLDKESLKDALNLYLQNPTHDAAAQEKFIEDECTFTDGSAGRRTGEYLLSLVQGK